MSNVLFRLKTEVRGIVLFYATNLRGCKVLRGQRSKPTCTGVLSVKSLANKESPDHLLSLSHPFRCQTKGGDREEGVIGPFSNANQSLASAVQCQVVKTAANPWEVLGGQRRPQCLRWCPANHQCRSTPPFGQHS